MDQVSRLKVGVDVPWVTSWSSEAVLGVGPCASLNGALAVRQAERPGHGRPNYSRNHLDRQRWSVRRMLCPMCGQPTQAGDRWMVTARRLTAGELRAKGLGAAAPADLPDSARLLDAGGIAPAHLTCTRLALERCPHLQAHGAPEPIAFPRRWAVFPLRVEPPAGHAVLARRPGDAPVSFLQLCGVED